MILDENQRSFSLIILLNIEILLFNSSMNFDNGKSWNSYINSSGALEKKYGLTLIPAGISNYIHYPMWDKITYPLPNFKGAAIGSLGMDK